MHFKAFSDISKPCSADVQLSRGDPRKTDWFKAVLVPQTDGDLPVAPH